MNPDWLTQISGAPAVCKVYSHSTSVFLFLFSLHLPSSFFPSFLPSFLLSFLHPIHSFPPSFLPSILYSSFSLTVFLLYLRLVAFFPTFFPFVSLLFWSFPFLPLFLPPFFPSFSLPSLLSFHFSPFYDSVDYPFLFFTPLLTYVLRCLVATLLVSFSFFLKK